jgi:RNA polymerase sigma factor (sigma-70 family)
MTIFDGNRALLDAFRRGERWALEVVYRHYVRQVDALIRRGFYIAEKSVSIPGVHSAAEHLEHVQEVFVRAFTEAARLAYNALKLYRPYLLRIGKNLLVDRARKIDRHVLGKIDDLHQTLASLPDDALTLGQELDNDPEWQSAAAATREFIATLPETERKFVELRFVLRQSQSDAGAALNLTRKQVRRKEELIRESLRTFLSARGLGAVA